MKALETLMRELKTAAHLLFLFLFVLIVSRHLRKQQQIMALLIAHDSAVRRVHAAPDFYPRCAPETLNRKSAMHVWYNLCLCTSLTLQLKLKKKVSLVIFNESRAESF